MSDQIDKVKLYMDGLNNKDIQTALDQMADDFCLNDPFYDELQPKTAVAAMFHEQVPNAPIRFIPESFVEDSDTVYVNLKLEFMGQLYRSVNVFTFRDGKMIQLNAFSHGLKEAAKAAAASAG